MHIHTASDARSVGEQPTRDAHTHRKQCEECGRATDAGCTYTPQAMRAVWERKRGGLRVVTTREVPRRVALYRRVPGVGYRGEEKRNLRMPYTSSDTSGG